MGGPLADLRHDDLMRSIGLFGTDIMPAVRAAEAAEAEAAGGWGHHVGRVGR